MTVLLQSIEIGCLCSCKELKFLTKYFDDPTLKLKIPP